MTADAAPTSQGPDELPILGAAAGLVVASAIFGGASGEDPARLAIVELSSLPLLLMAVRGLIVGGRWRALVGPLAVLATIIAVPLAQLIPLPPAIWTRLPGHAPEVRALALAGLPWSWRPIDLAPQAGETSALALLPPSAMFLGALRLRWGSLRLLTGLWLALGVVGVALGAFQLSGPQGSPAYLYASTNYVSLLGFFANRNHEASFLLVLLPFAAVFAARGLGRAGGKGLVALLASMFFLLATVALATVRSRAGIILCGPALLAAMAIIWRASDAPGRMRTVAAVGGLITAGVLGVGLFAMAPILERFDRNTPPEVRLQAWPYVEKAANDYLPLGSGIGSFDTVYPAVEPLSLLSPPYLHHAHNDYLETWLETGWLGMLALAAFLIWFAPAAWGAWRRRGPETDLARAASVAVALLLAHSFVDYPLRTTALSTLLAFSCAVLALNSIAPARTRASAVAADRTEARKPPDDS
jgi:O-antigen ligase